MKSKINQVLGTLTGHMSYTLVEDIMMNDRIGSEYRCTIPNTCILLQIPPTPNIQHLYNYAAGKYKI